MDEATIAAIDALMAGGASDAQVAQAETAARVYCVQFDDTVDSIAAAHGTTADALLAANVGTIIDPGALQVAGFINLP